MSDTIEVRPDQVWADNDARCEGRTVRVDTVDDTYAYCTVLTNTYEVQRYIDAGFSGYADRRGSQTRMKLTRMRPTSTGYRLVQDAPA